MAAEAIPIDAPQPAATAAAQRRARIRAEMGGAERVAAIHAAGRLTVRERIDALLDSGSFQEIGTFAASEREADTEQTPGDGKVGGHGLIAGRPVTVAGDDITVKRGSSSAVGGARLHRLHEQAIENGNPFVYFGETGGGRIPDMLGSRGFTRMEPLGYLNRRMRRVPMATVICGESFGGSSFYAASSDFCVQVEGSCLAITSPRVVEIATGEAISMEDLGGAGVHSRLTGQIDLAVPDDHAAIDAVRRFLDFLPLHCEAPIERRTSVPAHPGRALSAIVPAERRRAYDMRRLIRALVDDGSFLELQPGFAPSLLAGLARLDGWPVGVLANQPMQQAGILTPDSCGKAAQLIALCDSFGLALVFLHDTPGFMVGRQVEHGRGLDRAMLLQSAVALATVPTISVVVRKSFGLAHHLMCGVGMDADLLCAWPGAEISFMDPDVGANVVHGRELAGLGEEARATRLAELSARMGGDSGPLGAAQSFRIDEIIEPDETRAVIAGYLHRAAGRLARTDRPRHLASWPVSL